MKVIDITDRLAELTRAVSGLVVLVYDQDSIPATGREIASLLSIMQREVETVAEVIAGLYPGSMR